MRKVLLPLIAMLVLLSACTSKKSTDKTNDSTTTKDSLSKQEDEKITDKTDHSEKKGELEKMTPLTKEDLEKLLPAELKGAPATDISSNTNLGTAMAMASYPIDNNPSIRLIIMDCAGPAGVGAYVSTYENALNADRSDDNEYYKTIDFNQTKAIEHCNKADNICSITWFNGKRFIISIEGNSIDIIRQAGKGLILD